MIGEWRIRLSDPLLLVLLVLLSTSQGLGVVRLQNGGLSYGRLEVYYNGTWGTVCDNNFGRAEAKVACGELGLDQTEYQVFESSKFGEGSGTIWLDEVSCTGSESTLDSCTHNSYGDHDCTHSMDVGISCGEYIEPGTLRLVNGDERSGRLEVYYNETWGTVCNDFFAVEDARVACRQLDLDSSSVEYFGSSKYGEGTGPIWLDQVSCIGWEGTIDSCVHNAYGDHDCTHSQDVGISCGTGESLTPTARNFWHGSGKWMGSVIFVIVMIIACAGSAYRRRQLYLMRHQLQNNGDTNTVPAATTNNPGVMSYATQQPPQQTSEPRPYPVQTYSPVNQPASTGGAPPDNQYPMQAYPPPVQDPSGDPTQLPPVENTGPYPPQGGSAPYPTHQPGDAPPVYQPQSGTIKEGDLPPPPSYNDVIKR